MTLYQNGHPYSVAVRCCPPTGHDLPVVEVEMAGASGMIMPVAGKVDTGAFRTMLNLATAKLLGIDDPTSSPIEKAVAHTATDEEFTYYVHLVSVRIAHPSGRPIEFPLKAAFAERLRRNLFGRDWLVHLCLAVDCRAVHFLRD